MGRSRGRAEPHVHQDARLLPARKSLFERPDFTKDLAYQDSFPFSIVSFQFVGGGTPSASSTPTRR